jgi:hypothetical protein
MNDLVSLLNHSAYSFFFLVVDRFLDIEGYPTLQNFHLIYASPPRNLPQLQASQTPFFYLQNHPDHQQVQNSGDLLSQPEVEHYIQAQSGQNTPVIIPFKPSAKLDLICQRHSWILAANPSSLNRLLEDKIKFPSLCAPTQIPLIPHHLYPLTSPDFKQSLDEFGSPLVVQTHFGWAGKSTFQASSWSEISSQVSPGQIVKVSPYLVGYSLLNNAVISSHGLIQSPPALQYTGIPPYTTNPFTTVGRQWPAPAPKSVLNQVTNITQEFGLVLAKHHYRGFFGLDFFVDLHHQVYLLECNPRLTASFAFYTTLETKANLTPLFYYHLMSFLPLPYPKPSTRELNRHLITLTGSEITPRNPDQQIIQKYQTFTPLSPSCHPLILPPLTDL